MLNERGSLLGARVVTLEAQPRVIELRGTSVLRVQHAYGTNGIIIELEIPLAPVQPWEELAVAFDDFMQLARFCQNVGETDCIAKKLVTAVAWPLSAYFKTLASDPAPGRALGLFLIGVSSVDAFLELLDGFGGTVVYRKSDAQASAENLVPIYEYTWNHTTLQVLKLDRDVTYLQSAFPDLTLVEQMIWRYGDEVMMPSSSSETAASSRFAVCRSSATPMRSGCARSFASTKRTAARSSTRTRT